MTWEVTNEAKIAKFESLSDEDLVRHHSTALCTLEVITYVAANRLLERADGNMVSDDAILSAKVRAEHFGLRSYHSRMDALSAEAMQNPVPEGGER